MKILIITVFSLCFMSMAMAQTKSKPKEKAPTQKEMQEMMNEAQKMMGELSEEEKKMMDSLGINIPDFNKSKKAIAGVSDKQLAEAWDEENQIIPKKSATRIAAIPPLIAPEQINNYIKATNQKALALYSSKEISLLNRMFSDFKSKNSSTDYLGNAAITIWLMGYPKIALASRERFVKWMQPMLTI